MQDEVLDGSLEQASHQENEPDKAPARPAWQAFLMRRMAKTQSRRFVIELLCLTVIMAVWEIAGAWGEFGHSRQRFGQDHPALAPAPALKAVRPRRHRTRGLPRTDTARQAASASTQARIDDFDAQVAKLQEQLKASKQAEGR